MVVTRDEAKEIIRTTKKCTDYLEKNRGSSQHNCPFCNSGKGKNHTGAVKYYARTNTCFCFACSKQFDVFDLAANYMGLDVTKDFNKVFSLLANELNLNVEAPQEPLKNKGSINTRQNQEVSKMPSNDVTEANKERADYNEYYKECKARITDEAAVNYLTSRGISLETAGLMNLGFDPQADPINNPGNTHSNKYPTARIIAPVTQDYYIARGIDPKLEPQYKAPNPTRDLGGGEPTISNIEYLYDKDYGIVFVTEGLFDTLSLLEIGKPAIALNSTSNADKLISQLENRPTAATLVLCLDNDEAGRKCTRKLTEALNKLQIEYTIPNISGTFKDPNEALQNDREAFTNRVNEAETEAYNKCLGGFLERIQSEAYRPHKTNLSFFDDLLGGGVIDQTLMLLYAAPGAGKTTLCQQIAEKLAEDKQPVLYLNLEMSREQMLAKAISAKIYKELGIVYSFNDILQGYNWRDEQRTVIVKAVTDYSRTNGRYIKYNPGAENGSSSIDNIIALLEKEGTRSVKNGTKAPVVILDYLHLVSCGAEKLDDQELIKKVVFALKNYAIKYNTFVIAIGAIGRDSMKNGVITLNSGRDSSNLEYTADYVVSLNYYAVDTGDATGKKIDPQNVKEMTRLKRMEEKEMILRLLKNRTGVDGTKKETLFIAPANTFIEPGEAHVFTGRLPFDDNEE